VSTVGRQIVIVSLGALVAGLLVFVWTAAPPEEIAALPAPFDLPEPTIRDGSTEPTRPDRPRATPRLIEIPGSQGTNGPVLVEIGDESLLEMFEAHAAAIESFCLSEMEWLPYRCSSERCFYVVPQQALDDPACMDAVVGVEGDNIVIVPGMEDEAIRVTTFVFSAETEAETADPIPRGRLAAITEDVLESYQDRVVPY